MIIPWAKIVWISDHKGYGLLATQDIPKGTITFAQDGLDIVISNKDLNKIDPKLLEYVEKYSYEDLLGNRIISWDLGKYMNHDDQANTLSTGYGFEVAVKDIKTGEEITDDYRIFSTYHNTKTWQAVEEKDPLKPWPKKLLKEWNTKVLSALLNIESTQQPLKGFIGNDIWDEVLKLNETLDNYRCVSQAFPLRYKLQTNGKLPYAHPAD